MSQDLCLDSPLKDLSSLLPCLKSHQIATLGVNLLRLQEPLDPLRLKQFIELITKQNINKFHFTVDFLSMGSQTVNQIFRLLGLNIDLQQLTIRVKNTQLSPQNVQQLMNSLKFSSKMESLIISLPRNIKIATLEEYIQKAFSRCMRSKYIYSTLHKIKIIINFNSAP